MGEYKIIRSQSYHGVENTGKNDIEHWKYIKKVKSSNGKWRYIYDESQLDKYNNGAEESHTETTEYRNSNNMLSNESSITWSNGDRNVAKSRGKIERYIDKGKDWLNKKLKGYSYTDKYDSKTRSTSKVTTKYGKTNRLFDSTTTFAFDGGKDKTVYKNQGKLSRGIAKGEKWIYEKFYSKRK